LDFSAPVGFIHSIINFSGIHELIAYRLFGWVRLGGSQRNKKKGGHDQLSISGKSRTTIWNLPEKKTDG
jgi:hypothetical protein